MIRLSKKGEYAIRAMVEIAQAAPSGALVPIAVIAQHTGIPEKFLEQILLLLKNGGILKSKRGMDGGYGLNRTPSDIPMREIYRLTEGPLAPFPCLDSGASAPCPCPDPDSCPIRISLEKIHRAVQNSLVEESLETILGALQQKKSQRMTSGQYDI